MKSEFVCLECPSCRNEIRRPIEWFKQTYATCPACGGGIAEGQFAAVIAALEEAMEEETAAMIDGKTGCKGCGGGECR